MAALRIEGWDSTTPGQTVPQNRSYVRERAGAGRRFGLCVSRTEQAKMAWPEGGIIFSLTRLVAESCRPQVAAFPKISPGS